MIIIDARGLNCPQPVIKTKQALDKLPSGYITTIVDNEVAKKNVEKLAIKMGYGVQVEKENTDYKLTITKDSIVTTSQPVAEKNNDNGLVIFCASDKFGEGEVALSNVLMKAFFYAFTEHTIPPKAIIFMNAGVLLALNDSPVLDSIKELAEKGTEVLSCGTCLDYYNKKASLAVGEITNMYTATEVLSEATQIIRI